MISSTAGSARAPGPAGLDQGTSGRRGLRAPTARTAQPGRSPRAAGARGGERRRARSSSPSSPPPSAVPHRLRPGSSATSNPRWGSPHPSQPPPRGPDPQLLLPPQTAGSGQHLGAGRRWPQRLQKASGCKRPLFRQPGVGRVKECSEKGPPRGSGGVPRPYQHWRWKAAGQWSQHRRSPPSLQLSQLSWLVALPLRRGSFSGFRLRFSASSVLGGASRAWICCTHIQMACVHTRRSRAVRRPPGAASPSPTPLPPFVLLPPIQPAPRTSQPPEPGGAQPNRVPAAQQRERLLPNGEDQSRGMGRGCAVPFSPLPCMDSGGLQSQARERPEAQYPDVLGEAQRGRQEGGGEARRCNEMEWVGASGERIEGGG